jgi:hypothetical protein
MSQLNSYIRFLRLVEELHSKSKLQALDATEKTLLNHIMLDDHAGRSVLVGDILKWGLIGSQATLHGRLKNLRLMGYIKLVEQNDMRRKRVMPTRQAYQLFAQLSSCMIKAYK